MCAKNLILFVVMCGLIEILRDLLMIFHCFRLLLIEFDEAYQYSSIDRFVNNTSGHGSQSSKVEI